MRPVGADHRARGPDRHLPVRPVSRRNRRPREICLQGAWSPPEQRTAFQVARQGGVWWAVFHYSSIIIVSKYIRVLYIFY